VSKNQSEGAEVQTISLIRFSFCTPPCIDDSVVGFELVIVNKEGNIPLFFTSYGSDAIDKINEFI
jgi:hypothetical protein